MNRYRVRLLTSRLSHLKNPLLKKNGLIPDAYKLRYKFAVECMRSIQAPVPEQIVELESMMGKDEGGD